MARSTGLHCHAGDTAASPHWSRGHMATLPAWHVMVWHVMVWQQAQASSECRRRLPARLDHGLLLCSAALMSSVHCTPLCSATGGHCMACALRGHMRAHACAPHSMSWACMGCTQIHAHTSTSAHRHAHVHPHTHPHSRMYTHMHICTRCMSCKIYMNGAQTSMCAHTHTMETACSSCHDSSGLSSATLLPLQRGPGLQCLPTAAAVQRACSVVCCARRCLRWTRMLEWMCWG